MSAPHTNLMLRLQSSANSERSEPKQLKIDFHYGKEDDKTQNASISGYDGFVPEKVSRKELAKVDAGLGFTRFAEEYFDYMRRMYYGDDWVKLLFPSLFFN